MRSSHGWIVFLAALGLSACGTALPRPVVLGDPPPARDAATVKTRWIGMTRPGAACPASASGWQGGPLYPTKDLAADLGRAARKAGLDRFCVYDYAGPDPVPPLPESIAQSLLRAEPDRVAFSSSANSLQEGAWRPLAQRFFYQVQRLDKLPPSDTPQVRLALLDSQPTGEGLPRSAGNSEHGYTLAHVAGQLNRGQGDGRPGPVQIATRLALPVVGFADGEVRVDLKRGGFRGTYRDLTRAIWDEIVHWKTGPSPRARHLVLNLSLGWDGVRLGDWIPERNGLGRGVPLDAMTPDTLAVYQALDFAADLGVLVIAAAGNEQPGPEATVQPFLPAAWESQERRPQPWWSWPWWGGERQRRHRPLVYAVSGVDGQGHPLVNTRALGEAPRVAYADHAVVSDGAGYTATLTGTSVATTVVATAAALAWSYRPGLEAGELMQLLDRSGDALPRFPNFTAPSVRSPGPVRRIALCPALMQICPDLLTSCPDCFAGCAQSPVPGPIEPELAFFKPMHWLNGTTLIPVPVDHLFPSILDQPWIGPQPGSDPCPSCMVTRPPEVDEIRFASLSSPDARILHRPSSSFKLRAEIPGTWQGGLLSSATLEVFGFNERGRKVSLGSRSLEVNFDRGSSMQATGHGSGLIQPGKPFQAVLSFILAPPDTAPPGTPPLSIQSPLFIEN